MWSVFQGDPSSALPPGGSCWTLQGVAPLRWRSQVLPAPHPGQPRGSSSGLGVGGRGRGFRRPSPPRRPGVPVGSPAQRPPITACARPLPRPPPRLARGWAVPRGQAAPAGPVRRRPGRGGRRELSRAAAQRPRRPGTNISLCGGSEGRGGARGGGGRGELDPPRVIAVRWDLGLIPWATQGKAPCPILCPLERVPHSPKRKRSLRLGGTLSFPTPRLARRWWEGVLEG